MPFQFRASETGGFLGFGSYLLCSNWLSFTPQISLLIITIQNNIWINYITYPNWPEPDWWSSVLSCLSGPISHNFRVNSTGDTVQELRIQLRKGVHWRKIEIYNKLTFIYNKGGWIKWCYKRVYGLETGTKVDQKIWVNESRRKCALLILKLITCNRSWQIQEIQKDQWKSFLFWL